MSQILNLVTAINYIQVKELPALTLNPHTIISQLSTNNAGANFNDLLLMPTLKGWAICSVSETGPIALGPGRFTFKQTPLPPSINLQEYPETTVLRIVTEDQHAVLQEITEASE